ncbi:hypothetical protein SETIT_4G176900v2, partial [Setaria italica]
HGHVHEVVVHGGRPRSRRRRPRRPRRRGGGAAAGAQLLLPDVPQPGQDRAAGNGLRRAEGEAHGRLHPPHVLPRLLRQWMRRLDPVGRHVDLHRREGRRPQRQLGARLRGHRRHQGPGRGLLHGHRLLRRHPRPRRPRRRQPAGRPDVERAAGPEGLAHGEPERGQRQPPRPGVQPLDAHLHVREPGPVGAGHDGAVGGAHHRAVAVPVLPEPHLHGTQRQRLLRGAPAADVPALGGRRQPRAVRRADPRRVRQRLLPEPAAAEGAPPLGPGALQRRVAGRAGQAVQQQPGAVQQRLCHGHDQDGKPAAVGRDQDGGQAQLQEGQL